MYSHNNSSIKESHFIIQIFIFTSCITISWHFLINWFSAFTMVCRNLRYCTCFPWVSMQWTKCCMTFGLTSLHRVELSWNILQTVCASLMPGFKNSSNCLCNKTWFCWLPRQKFCRKSWASRMSSIMRTSSLVSKGTCSKSRTIVWTPTFRRRRCSCFLGFIWPPGSVWMQSLFIRMRICWIFRYSSAWSACSGGPTSRSIADPVKKVV